ncbi:DUF4089 domain-containing protein [Stappia sp. BW2]|jgi:hypothetical protein|uniref:DUF4089 domain-containing protein n=1 Tax=Stappia sp. BW2 TaxID=2592622 RepID=UPI0011DECF61|nr:DUF4089 domain-containing protein [Stappia sp. BW2]TYC64100.1 DUF4089 domain-containing protein [Stappia sp. BW2]
MSAEFDPKSHVAHMEKVMGLTIKDDWRPVVEAHIAATQKAAELVLAFPLEDDVEAAPVFEA